MSSSSRRKSVWLSCSVLASAAGLFLAGAAQAQSAPDWDAVRESQSGPGSVAWQPDLEPQILIANPGTPTTARDPVNITGVGQMIVDQQNGFIGLCTGTLINPRTVIFAAHCVNERDANAYGAASGGTPIGFGFGANNNVAGASAFGGWLGDHQTNTARFMYNSNYVAYNPASLEANSAGFLYGDVAIATLDTVAKGIPAWSMLFSALPATPITAGGTGYHVNINGYGNNGTGTSGSTGGIDFRRRVAENTLGALASLDDFEGFLFGSGSGLPQNLYWIDFDDPRRGTAQASPFDFNAWRDNALPKEGITAQGDSGGPLILDAAFAKPVVIGVLSGGYTRFFNGQPANGYGTAAFYQPLYLYWDWIAANNPYHYVTATAGNANWNDASHWVTGLDPNYQVIGSNGQLVNGVPTAVGEGPAGTTGQFGQACFQSGGFSECQDMATGEVVSGPKPIGTGAVSGLAIVSSEVVGEVSHGSATVSTASLNGSEAEAAATSSGVASQNAAAPAAVAAALPAATLLNGLPGATNFTPNNFDGDPLTSAAPRYFDVTLSANGTTTLNTAVVIDRLTLAGAGAGLNITSTGSLFSHIDITQLIGTLTVDGSLRTPGDMFLMAGGLSGRGSITAPFFTSMAGVIAPGTVGTTGTLTFNGNVVLASGNALLIDLGAAGVSDRIAVAATQFGGVGGTTPIDGQANIGGLVAFSVAQGATPVYNSSYTFLTAQGGLTGAFTAGELSGVLRPTLSYTANSASVTITADSFSSFIDSASPSQRAVGALLDRARNSPGGYTALSSIFNQVDTLEGAALGGALESLSPYSAVSAMTLGVTSSETVGDIVSDRIAMRRDGTQPEGLSIIGGVQVAASDEALPPIAAAAMLAAQDAEAARTRWNSGWKQGVSAFLAAGGTQGDSGNLSGTVIGTAQDEQDTWYVAGGVERTLDGMTIGASLAYADGESDFNGGLARSETEQVSGSVYTSVDMFQTGFFGGYIGYGRMSIDTERTVILGPTTLRSVGDTDGSIFSTGFELGDHIDMGGLSLTPSYGVDVYNVEVEGYTETGSAAAMIIDETDYDSVQGFIGLRLDGETGMGGFRVRPSLGVRGVSEIFGDENNTSAAFAGAGGPSVTFIGTSRDETWGEVSGSVLFEGERFNVMLQAASVFERDDLDYQSYRATVSMSF